MESRWRPRRRREPRGPGRQFHGGKKVKKGKFTSEPFALPCLKPCGFGCNLSVPAEDWGGERGTDFKTATLPSVLLICLRAMRILRRLAWLWKTPRGSAAEIGIRDARREALQVPGILKVYYDAIKSKSKVGSL